MWRSLFLSVGLASFLLGGEFLAINKATLTMPADESVQERPFMNTVHETFHTRDFVPPEWAPWTLLSVGAVIFLYANTVSKD
jgi:hypothetical protein